MASIVLDFEDEGTENLLCKVWHTIAHEIFKKDCILLTYERYPLFFHDVQRVNFQEELDQRLHNLDSIFDVLKRYLHNNIVLQDGFFRGEYKTEVVKVVFMHEGTVLTEPKCFSLPFDFQMLQSLIAFLVERNLSIFSFELFFVCDEHIPFKDGSQIIMKDTSSVDRSVCYSFVVPTFSSVLIT